MLQPNFLFYYTLYSLSVFSMAKSLQLILEISVTYRLASYLPADNWLICRLRVRAMHDFQQQYQLYWIQVSLEFPFTGKIIAQSTDIVASKETVQKEDLPKREGHRENKKDERKGLKDTKMNTRKNNSLQKDGGKCGIKEMAQNVSLKSGMNAGNFKLHKTVHNITSCTERCCEDPLCDIAVIMTNRCYTVQCYSPKDCESKESETPDIIIAYLDNHLRNNQNGTTPTTHIIFNEDRKINKKTVIPNSSEGT